MACATPEVSIMLKRKASPYLKMKSNFIFFFGVQEHNELISKELEKYICLKPFLIYILNFAVKCYEIRSRLPFFRGENCISDHVFLS